MSKIDRREFLKTGARGAALISLPALTRSYEDSNRNRMNKVAARARKNHADNSTLFKLVLVSDSHVRLEMTILKTSTHPINLLIIRTVMW